MNSMRKEKYNDMIKKRNHLKQELERQLTLRYIEQENLADKELHEASRPPSKAQPPISEETIAKYAAWLARHKTQNPPASESTKDEVFPTQKTPPTRMTASRFSRVLKPFARASARISNAVRGISRRTKGPYGVSVTLGGKRKQRKQGKQTRKRRRKSTQHK